MDAPPDAPADAPADDPAQASCTPQPGLVDAAADLLLGGRCVGCARPGRLLCATCEQALPTSPGPAWPTPVPDGLAPPWAAAAYAGTVRAMVVGHKEHGLLGLRTPLARLLAAAATTALGPVLGPVVLVPVPSRARSVRSRGYDATAALTSRAARLLRDQGLDVRSARLLRSRPGVEDQSGLDAAARAANVAGSMCCHGARVRRLAGRLDRAWCVVCDDVVTTGSTAREAQRALEAVGLQVTAVAAVAATVLRRSTGAADTTQENPGRRVLPRGIVH